jgi:hypothetical protein
MVNELLARIVEAHGGLDRWRGFNRVEATIVTDGAFWGMKNLTQDQDPRQMTVSLHEERSSVAPFGDPDWHTEFTPNRIAILRSDGTVVAERDDPRASFAGHEKMTPWDPLHRAYFNGYALWTYLTTPFLLTMEGVQVTEMEPWTEGGETWRVLRARFPESIARPTARFRTSSSAMTFCFDATTTMSMLRAASTRLSWCTTISKRTAFACRASVAPIPAERTSGRNSIR